MKLHVMAAIAALTALGGCSTLDKREQVVKAPTVCADQTVQVYFDADSAELTPDGKKVLEAAVGALRGCKVPSVEVLGLADAVGAPQVNLELSRRRSEAVFHALTAAGLPAAEFKLGAAGQAGAVTADGQVAPVRRRVDVTLHATRP